MADDEPKRPIFLIVIDEDRGVFSVEGPMTDDHPWQSAARKARDRQHRIVCGPAGVDRDALAADFVRMKKLAGVPPGSIVRPVRESGGLLRGNPLKFLPIGDSWLARFQPRET
jgi:hypothetical protein